MSSSFCLRISQQWKEKQKLSSLTCKKKIHSLIGRWRLHVFSGFCETKTEKRRLRLKKKKKNNKRKKERKLYNIVEQNKSWSINQLKSWELDMLWWTVVALWFNLLVWKKQYFLGRSQSHCFSICSNNTWKRMFYSFTTRVHMRRNIFLPWGAPLCGRRSSACTLHTFPLQLQSVTSRFILLCVPFNNHHVTTMAARDVKYCNWRSQFMLNFVCRTPHCMLTLNRP